MFKYGYQPESGFSNSVRPQTGTAVRTQIPVPPMMASARYRPLITAIETLQGKELTEQQKEMFIKLAESGELHK